MTTERPYRYSRPNPPMPSARDIERFWSYVIIGTPDECWPWRTRKRGMFWWVDEHGVRQHEITPRIAFRIAKDAHIPPDQVVCHSCDWRACCNPAHLSCDTQQKNSHDMAERGLHPYMDSDLFSRSREGWWTAGKHGPGEDHSNSKLTDEIIYAIRALYAAGGIRQIDLAARFGIGQSHVSRIVRGEAWPHLPR